MRMIFFPGLGADARLAQYHQGLGVETRWQEWIAPEEDESFEEYVLRMGRAAGASPEDVLAGVSLGGTVALALARQQGARGVVVIGSPRCAADVAAELRASSVLVDWVPSALVEHGWIPPFLLRRYFGVEAPEQCALLLDMARRVGTPTMRRLARWALSIDHEVHANVPVLSLHGTADRIVPFREDRGHVAIEGAGHMVSMTHSDVVREKIRCFVAAIRSPAATRPYRRTTRRRVEDPPPAP